MVKLWPARAAAPLVVSYHATCLRGAAPRPHQWSNNGQIMVKHRKNGQIMERWVPRPARIRGPIMVESVVK